MAERVYGDDDWQLQADDRARMRTGGNPNLVGWEQILKHIGQKDVRTGRSWRKAGMPVVSFGKWQVAAWSDLVDGWVRTRHLVPKKSKAAA